MTTRAARERLASRREPYWRGIEAGIALGYRRGMQGGAWLAQLLTDGRYREERLGRADDTLPANGADVLDFRQAQTKTVAWASRARRIAAGLEAGPAKGPVKPYTVADAVADYLADMKARGARSLATTRTAAEAHIIPTLGTVAVAGESGLPESGRVSFVDNGALAIAMSCDREVLQRLTEAFPGRTTSRLMPRTHPDQAVPKPVLRDAEGVVIGELPEASPSTHRVC